MKIIPKEIVENPFKLLPRYGRQIGQVQVHGYHDAASIYYEKGKVISEEKYLENQSPAVMLMSNYNDGESRGQISNLSPVTEQTVSGDRINPIPNRIDWTAKKGG